MNNLYLLILLLLVHKPPTFFGNTRKIFPWKQHSCVMPLNNSALWSAQESFASHLPRYDLQAYYSSNLSNRFCRSLEFRSGNRRARKTKVGFVVRLKHGFTRPGSSHMRQQQYITPSILFNTNRTALILQRLNLIDFTWLLMMSMCVKN